VPFGGRVQLQSGADFSGNANLSADSNVLAYEYTRTVDNKSINMDGTTDHPGLLVGLGLAGPGVAA